MEIWVPYGDVESLLTIQAENLAELLDPAPEPHTDEISAALVERAKGAEKFIICDTKPSTMKVLKAVAPLLKDSTKFVSPNPRKVELEVPDLKDLVAKLEPPSQPAGIDGVQASADVLGASKKFALATGEPDPLFGYVDARVSLALASLAGARRIAYDRRDGDEPRVLKESPAYSALLNVLETLQGFGFATLISRGGHPYSMIEGGVKEAQASQTSPEIAPTKGMVAGAGGRGYDETFSHAIRLLIGVMKAVRKGGDIILVAECREGIGSDALRTYLTGRITDNFLKKGNYIDGVEEIGYLKKLNEEYSVTMLSSLPELYASGKMKFRTARGAGEALTRTFASVGRTAKLNVVTRACETVLP